MRVAPLRIKLVKVSVVIKPPKALGYTPTVSASLSGCSVRPPPLPVAPSGAGTAGGPASGVSTSAPSIDGERTAKLKRLMEMGFAPDKADEVLTKNNNDERRTLNELLFQQGI